MNKLEKINKPANSNLEEAAMQYAKSKHKDITLQQIVSWDFKAGAQWQKEQNQSTIELAEDHAYLAGQEKIIAKACEWLNNYFKGIAGGSVYIEDFKKSIEK